MPKDNMTERITGTTPDLPVEEYKMVPQFEGTVTLPINAGDLGVEWELKAPTSDSTSYVEKGKRGFKFTKEGKELADYNWNAVLAISGMDAGTETIKENAGRVLETLQDNPSAKPEYNQVLKRSFEARIAYMEKEKFWAEMQASNSPWNEAIENIGKQMYPELPLAFVKNFSTSAVKNIRDGISKQVEGYAESGKVQSEDKDFIITAYEARIANHLTRHLENLDTGKLQNLRESGIWNLKDSVFDEKRFTEHDPEGKPLNGYMNKTLIGVLAEKEKIAQITADDLNIDEKAKEKRTGFRERFSAKFTEFKQRVKNAFPDKQKVIRVALATAGVSLVFSGSNRSEMRQVDIDQAFSWPTPITRVISPDIELASSLTEIDESTDLYTPVQVVPGAAKAFTPTTQPAETAVIEPTTDSTSEALPEKPFVFGGIDFSNEESKISLGIDVNGKTLKTTFNPVVYEDNFSSTETGSFLDKVSPGKGSVAVDKDKYDNILLYCHSGYSGSNPLECEGLRNHIEGGDRDPNTPMLTREESQENMQELIGKVVPLDEDGKTKEFVISNIAYVPHDRKDEFDSNNKTSLDVLIEATGGENSPFNKYKDQDINAVFKIFCGWGPRSENNWWVYARYVIAYEPLEKVQNHESTAQTENVGGAAQILAKAINTANDKGSGNGTDLSNSIENVLRENGVEINERLEAKLRRVSNEIGTNNLQCVMGTELSAHLPGSEDWVDIGGLRIHDPENADKLGDGRRGISQASEIWKDMGTGEKMKALDYVGAVTNEDGMVRMRVDKVSMLTKGDVLVADSHPGQPHGHMARVVDVWRDNDGKYRALIFDVNFANDGKARIFEITDENMDEMIANVAEGQSARIITSRTYTSHGTWKFERENIQP
jgi:hypothetical protein